MNTSKKDQAPDANKAPGQETPSRSYGRQVHEDNNPESSDVVPTNANGQTKGEDRQATGTPSE